MKSAGWMGIDGEGIERFPHKYVMICVSTSKGEGDYIEDVRGIPTEQALDWILTVFKPGVKLAGYYLTYDWTKILADMPNRLLYRLLRPETRLRPADEGGGFSPVRWRGYQLHYLSGMMRIAKKGYDTATVWDLGKYYQARFTAALESSGIAPPELISRMKEERGLWTVDDMSRMREYCLEECRYLAALAELLEKQHHAIGLKPKAWHGPGSTAGALLAKHRIDTYIAKPPTEVEHAARCAYFGGRFEHAVMGEYDDVDAHDIRSAYPWATQHLPCLQHSRWVKRRSAPVKGETALIRYRVTDIGEERVWGPLPCRLQDDSIVWSRGGHSGWAWDAEWWPAVEGWSGVEYLRERWVLERSCDCHPFGFIPELYQWRVSRPENKQVVKLAINSVYGRLAQSAGGGGKYSCRVWAGIITSWCRGRMLQFIAAHRDETKLYAIATDGAFTSEDHRRQAGEGLGDWEVTPKGSMVFLRPGIYWAAKDIAAWYEAPSDVKAREKALKGVKARGVGRRKMLEQLEYARSAAAAGEPQLTMGTTTLFGSFRECVYRTQGGEYRRSKAYGEWVESPVSLSLNPMPKRNPDWSPRTLGGVESKPYLKGGASPDARMLRVIGSLLEGRL